MSLVNNNNNNNNMSETLLLGGSWQGHNHSSRSMTGQHPFFPQGHGILHI